MSVEKSDTRFYKELTILRFYIGLRIDEAFALQWKDTDILNRQIDIKKPGVLMREFLQQLK